MTKIERPNPQDNKYWTKLGVLHHKYIADLEVYIDQQHKENKAYRELLEKCKHRIGHYGIMIPDGIGIEKEIEQLLKGGEDER